MSRRWITAALGLLVSVSSMACGDEEGTKGGFDAPDQDFDLLLTGIVVAPGRADSSPWDGPVAEVDRQVEAYVDSLTRPDVVSDATIRKILDAVNALPERPDLTIELHSRSGAILDTYNFPDDTFYAQPASVYLGTTCPACVYIDTRVSEIQFWDRDVFAHDFAGAVRMEQTMANLVFANDKLAWLNVTHQTNGEIIAIQVRAVEAIAGVVP